MRSTFFTRVRVFYVYGISKLPLFLVKMRQHLIYLPLEKYHVVNFSRFFYGDLISDCLHQQSYSELLSHSLWTSPLRFSNSTTYSSYAPTFETFDFDSIGRKHWGLRTIRTEGTTNFSFSSTVYKSFSYFLTLSELFPICFHFTIS